MRKILALSLVTLLLTTGCTYKQQKPIRDFLYHCGKTTELVGKTYSFKGATPGDHLDYKERNAVASEHLYKH